MELSGRAKRGCIIFFTFLFLSPFTFAAFAALPPQILSDENAAIYTQIFKLQDKENIAGAVALQKQLSDPLLIPDVLEQRYMSKTYKTSAKEISEWMGKYYDHPGADRIYKMAKKRKIGVRAPKLPSPVMLTFDSIANSESWTRKKYSGETERQIKSFKSSLRRGKTKNARTLLQDKSFQKKLIPEDYGRLCGRIAFVYYADGNFELARQFGRTAAAEKSEYGFWTMGLLSFKTDDFEKAQKYFSDMLNIDQVNGARKQEALFWAGRAADANDDKTAAKKFWKDAAARPQTFYGALAAAMLGDIPKYEFFDREWGQDDVKELMKTRYGIESLALLQIGERTRAETHLRYLITNKASDQLLHAVHAIANTAELPRASMQVSALLRKRDITEINPEVILSAQYPLPDWEPIGGWSIDRALLFAITRQESGFKTNAKSRVGASGLMQIMPKTARLVAKRQNMRMSDLDISNPEHNMFLGQQHIVDLLGNPLIENNIIKMLVSYNAGPGTMTKWEKQFQTDDPLLYIESFPAFETRGYIKRVLSNLWLYRARLNQPLTNIQDLAGGRWPRYESSDSFVGTIRAEREI
ncbi:MAG: lytic transglycosylase domain-containing protein [Rickettsiales bacterium]|nr:lytic transglycosylase domain-containing protein [Rickettsiales bacterium]